MFWLCGGEFEHANIQFGFNTFIYNRAYLNMNGKDF